MISTLTTNLRALGSFLNYRELAQGTSNFDEGEKLGEGGFGGVYRGFIKDLNSHVAVKRISSRSKQGMKE